jgi:hypothetical protein
MDKQYSSFAQSNDADSTTNTGDHWNSNSYNDSVTTRRDLNETPTVNSTNPNYNPITSNPTVDSLVNKGKTELKKGQHQAEDIVTKTKKVVQQQWDQTRHSLVEVQKKIREMVPKQGGNLIYWRNPIQSGIVFGVSLSVIITFMFLSSLAAISFWLLAFLLVVGLYKLYNYVMVTFVGRVQDDIFEYEKRVS